MTSLNAAPYLSTVNLGTSGFSAFSTLEPTSLATARGDLSRAAFTGDRSFRGDLSRLMGDLSRPVLMGDLSRPPFIGDLSLPPLIGDLSRPLFIGDLSRPLLIGDLSGFFAAGDLSRFTGDFSLDLSRLSPILAVS